MGEHAAIDQGIIDIIQFKGCLKMHRSNVNVPSHRIDNKHTLWDWLRSGYSDGSDHPLHISGGDHRQDPNRYDERDWGKRSVETALKLCLDAVITL